MHTNVIEMISTEVTNNDSLVNLVAFEDPDKIDQIILILDIVVV